MFTIALVLVILWFLGFSVFNIAGWLIHVLLILAIISVLVRVIRGK